MFVLLACLHQDGPSLPRIYAELPEQFILIVVIGYLYDLAVRQFESAATANVDGFARGWKSTVSAGIFSRRDPFHGHNVPVGLDPVGNDLGIWSGSTK